LNGVLRMHVNETK